ncbi:MAG: CGNR zinc finger domain-containing protein [Solirubrobacteraceae bacterium]
MSAPNSDTPDGLALVVDFVNTLDLESGRDQLDDPQALRAWLIEHGLLDAPEPVRAADLLEARSMREALRALMLANNGAPAAEGAGAELDRAARRGELSVHFGADATMRLGPCAEGLDGALAQLLAPVATAIGDGSWERVKACRADDCHWAFYDRSRNRSGVWCDMAVCGNRTKVRAYRERAPRATPAQRP